MTPKARFRRSLTIWGGVAAVGLYWLIAPLTDNNTVAEWLRIAMLVFGTVAAASQLPAFYRIWREDTEPSAQELILGYTLLMTGSAGAAGWLLLWRMAHFPVWMVQSAVNGFWLWLIVVGVVLIMMAPREPKYEPPRTNWARIAVAGVLTLIIGSLVLVWRPDVQPLVEWLRGHLTF